MFGLGCRPAEVMNTSSDVDLVKMEGTWIEIARMPILAQREDEYCWQDRYKINSEGTIDVVGSYRKGGPMGPWKHVSGTASIPDKKEPGKWLVQFIWPFKAHQWILDLDPNYQWVFFGHPNRKWLWIMSRDGKIDPQVLTMLVQNAKNLGYDTAKIIYDKPCSDLAPD